MLFLVNIWANPPGFFWDESGIAYNAWRIASTGTDMNGDRWPVYTTFIGGAMNMPFVYVLALVLAVTGPSIVAARLVAGALGYVGGCLLGVLAWRMTGRPWVGIATAAIALSSPWLFENSRLVFEVAIYPLAMTLLLLVVHAAGREERWQLSRILMIAGALALVTYGYSVGRLLGPALAASLVIFANRIRWRGVVGAWAAYAAMLLPLAIFAVSEPGWLTGRFNDLSYLSRASGPLEAALSFASHYLSTMNPITLLAIGDPNERHHVAGIMGSISVATLFFAVAGVAGMLLRLREGPWPTWMIVGLVVSPIPAALTEDSFHSLRLVPFFTFLTAFAGFGIGVLADAAVRFRSWRAVLGLALAAAVLQAGYFLARFHELGPARGAWLDAGFPALFEAAADSGDRIHVVDGRVPTHLHALWYAALSDVPEGRLRFVESSSDVPAGGIVVSGEESCDACSVIVADGFYRVYQRMEQ